MVVEVMSLGVLGLPVMLAAALGRLVAKRGRDDQEAEARTPAGPAIGLVTADALADLPLVAPGHAGYGTATHLLIQAARAQRAEIGTRPATVPTRGTRAA